MAAGAEGDAGAPYTDVARARLEMAFAAYELAELARTAVPVGVHELAPDGTAGPADSGGAGSALADAAQILAAAHRFHEAAVAFEHVRKGSRSAGTDTAAKPEETRWWRAYLAVAPYEAAHDLDDWVLRHRDGDHGLSGAPVSGGLFHRTDPSPPGIDG
ncbi:hypothetical protein [Streptomyces sp. NPDC058653]|uniref:hypothetical protein n=1 Tax=Streptomyces sp. NPDC058653 TaxID=3346576 RepID=UPI00365B0A63